MKNIFKKITMLSAIAFGFQASAVEIMVAPMKLKAQAEVLGLQAGVNGQAAIVYAGNTAANMAQAAGVAFNASREVLILTGSQATRLVGSAAQSAGAFGQQAILATSEFSADAVALGWNATVEGVEYARLGVNTLAQESVRALQSTVQMSKNAVTFVTDSSAVVLQTGSLVLGGTRNLLDRLLDLLLP